MVRSIGRMLAAVALVGLAGCASAGPPAASPGQSAPPAASASGPRRVVGVIGGDPFALAASVNEAGAGSVPGVDQVELLLNAGLTATDSKGLLEPRLAEEVPTVDNGNWVVNADGTMQTTWHLKPNITWQDGTPLTADDMVFSIKVVQDSRTGVLTTHSYDLIDRAEAPDPRTITLTWKSPFIHADAIFSSSGMGGSGGLRLLPLPQHLLQASYDQDAASFNKLPYWTSGFVGLGPFKLTDFVAGSHLAARANASYVLGRPKLDEVEVDFIPDPNTIAANLLAGSVDVTMNSRLDVDWGLQLRDKWTDGRLEPYQATQLITLFPQFINPDPPIQLDLNFREALVRSLNRQEMSDSILAGMSAVAHSLVGPADPAYSAVDPSVVKYDYDPRRAMQLLDGLGLTRGPDGMYRDQTGQPLSIELRTRGGDDLQEKMVAAVGDYLKQAGIGTTQNVFGAQLASDREFRANKPGLELIRGPGGGDGLADYPSSETPTADNGYRGSNKSRYTAPEWDALINRYFTTIPIADRNQVLAQAMNYMSRNIFAIGLDYVVDVTMVANRVDGVEPQNPAWNAHEWNVH